MTHLGLAHPKQMEAAVPANLKCGKPLHKTATRARLGAADLHLRRHLGSAAALARGAPAARCRSSTCASPTEFNGPLGHVPGAQLIPLGSLKDRIAELEKTAPMVVVCRSGARSAQATVLLGKAGFDKVANLSGGMLRWRAQRFAVEGGTE